MRHGHSVQQIPDFQRSLSSLGKEELAEKLKEMVPGNFSKVFFGLSGSDANDTQIKLFWYINNALGKTKKKKFLSRVQAYHGVTLATSSLTGLPTIHGNFDLPQNHFSHAMSPHYFMNKHEGESEQSFVERLGEDLENHINKELPKNTFAFSNGDKSTNFSASSIAGS